MDPFANLSPLDHRYATENPSLFERLSHYLSEEAFLRYQLAVEVALVQGLVNMDLAPAAAAAEVSWAAGQITAAEVAEEEQKTHHNIRALVNCLQRRVQPAYRPFVHWSATSADIMDSARALQYREATRELIAPVLAELEQTWIGLARRHAHTPQIGRTHGQHAVPITFGFALAGYVQRLGDRLQAILQAAKRLNGKIAGAVGAYNALSLRVPDPERFEAVVLGELGLTPAPVSTQIVPPEAVLDWVHGLVSAFGVLANFADDMRQLQRTEIAEVSEEFTTQQVGSSTMPHKRNPWNFEHVKSLWKEFLPRVLTVYLDQISEHQRDLTNSASTRFIPEIAAGLVQAAVRLDHFSRRLVVGGDQMQANLARSAPLFVAEPLYILLAAAGHPAAHEAVRRLTLRPEAGQRSLVDLAQADPELALYLARLSDRERELLAHPEQYRGRSAEKALAIADRWESQLASGRAADWGLPRIAQVSTDDKDEE